MCFTHSLHIYYLWVSEGGQMVVRASVISYTTLSPLFSVQLFFIDDSNKTTLFNFLKMSYTEFHLLMLTRHDLELDLLLK
jgi:hypothetical protein